MPNLEWKDCDDVVKTLVDAWDNQLIKKGPQTFTSTHEILGVVTEEYYELIEAVHNNSVSSVYIELLDLAIACVHGMASIDKEEENAQEKE